VASKRSYEEELVQAFEDLGVLVMSQEEYDERVASRATLWETTGLYDVVRGYIEPDLYNPKTRRKLKQSLDFAIPALKVYLEFDGFFSAGHGIGGHRNWSGFHRDRLKDRLMAFRSWRGLRYGPGDMRKFADVMSCAKEFLEFARMVYDKTI